MSYFYFKYINIPNYEELILEMQPYIMKLVEDQNLEGFHNIKINQFLQNCPLVNDYFLSKELELRAIAIIIASPFSDLGIHKDWIDTKFNSYALNMEILNCRKSHTSMYFCENEKESVQLLKTAKGANFWRIQDISKCHLVSEFNLTNAVFFDTNKIHQVCNPTSQPRVSISFRFSNKNILDIFPITILNP